MDGRRRALLALPGAALAAGCGFQLRRPPEMPFKRIALVGFGPQSALADELRRTLGLTVQVVTAASQAEVVLQSLLDVREKNIVASTAAGQVREVLLRIKFEFRARTPGGRELMPRAELLQERDMSYNETLALPKAQEEAQLYREMQTDIVRQVMRRLSTLRA